MEKWFRFSASCSENAIIPEVGWQPSARFRFLITPAALRTRKQLGTGSARDKGQRTRLGDTYTFRCVALKDKDRTFSLNSSLFRNMDILLSQRIDLSPKKKKRSSYGAKKLPKMSPQVNKISFLKRQKNRTFGHHEAAEVFEVWLAACRCRSPKIRVDVVTLALWTFSLHQTNCSWFAYLFVSDNCAKWWIAFLYTCTHQPGRFVQMTCFSSGEIATLSGGEGLAFWSEFLWELKTFNPTEQSLGSDSVQLRSWASALNTPVKRNKCTIKRRYARCVGCKRVYHTALIFAPLPRNQFSSSCFLCGGLVSQVCWI